MSHKSIAFMFVATLIVAAQFVGSDAAAQAPATQAPATQAPATQAPAATDDTKTQRGDKAAERGEQAEGKPTRRPARKGRPQPEIKVLDPAGFAKLQKKSIFSGPQVGEKVPEFTVMVPSDDGTETELNPIAKAAGKPLLLIFQDETGVGLRGLLGLSRTMKLINQKSDADAKVVVAFLGDDPNSLAKTAAKLRRFTDKDFVLALSKDGRDGPGSLGLNRNLASTILLVKAGKVKHNFAMTQGMLRPDPHVLGGIADLLDIDREKMATWFASNEGAMRMRR